MRRLMLLACALIALRPAAAHVTLDPVPAPVDSFVRLAVRVPHGCDGAATVAPPHRLQVPHGLVSVRLMPKPGWTLGVVAGDAEEPGAAGHAAGPWPREIAWRGGPLSDDRFDEFLLMVRTPAAPGETLVVPFVQACEGGAVTRWIKRAGAGRPAPRWPAFLLMPKP